MVPNPNFPRERLKELEAENARLRQLLAAHGIDVPRSDGDDEERAQASDGEAEDPHGELDDPLDALLDDFEGLHLNPETGGLVFRGATSIPGQPAMTYESSVPSAWAVPSAAVPSFNLSQEGHARLLDLYFRYLNNFHGFVDESAFRFGMITAGTALSDPNSAYSPFLHLSILALAAHITDDPALHLAHTGPDAAQQQKGRPFLQAAMALLAAELERPRVTTVMALALVMPCLAVSGKVSQSWLFAGLAIRLAQDLGLHVDARPHVERGTLSAQEVQLREAAWWHVYFEDKRVSLYVGRSPTVTEADYSIPLPADPLRNAYIAISNILTRIVGSASEELDSDLQLVAPPAAPPPLVIMLHMLHNVAVILLKRPFLRRHSLDSPELEICISTAQHSAELSSFFDTTYGLTLAPITMSQCLHVPGSVIVTLLSLLPDDSPHRPFLQDALFQIRTNLSTLSRSWGTAAQALHALDASQRSDHSFTSTPRGGAAEQADVWVEDSGQSSFPATDWAAFDVDVALGW
ncbi:hypothetical protein JCM8097_002909 [Rhodosporidiobolus ruineniae]